MTSPLSNVTNVALVPTDHADEPVKQRDYTNEEVYAFLSRQTSLVAAAPPFSNGEVDTDNDVAEDVVELTTGMVALVPTMEDQQRLYVEGYESPDELHLTLRYLGDITTWGPELYDQVNSAIQAITIGQSSLSATGFGAAVWNPLSNSPCIVLNVGGSCLEDVRCAVDGALEGIWAIDCDDEYEPWSPHICVAYTTELSVLSQVVQRLGPITFDRVRVALGDEVIDHPLYANAMTASVETLATSPPASGTGTYDTTDPTAWEGILMVEGVPTGDGRQFALGSITWPEGWQPLRWTPADYGEHQGAVDVGRIDQIWRDTANSAIIRGRGVFNVNDTAGAQAFQNVADGFLKGVSVDVDSVTESDIEYVFPPTEPGDGEAAPDDLLALFGQAPELTIFHKGRIRGATLVSLPAFTEAQIQLAGMPQKIPTAAPMASGEGEMPESEALIASVNPNPPREWFDNPRLSGPTPLTVTDDGRVFGHAALFGTCHIGVQNSCVQPPYEEHHDYFSLGERDLGDETIAVGSITLGTGHASTYGLTASQALEHYDNTGTRVADVVTGNDSFGIWVAGALSPGVTAECVEQLRAAKLSGDWRRIGGQLRLVALLAVNVPGFPVPRLRTQLSHGKQVALVASGIITDEVRLATRATLRARMATNRRETLRKRMDKSKTTKKCATEGDE